MSIRKQERTVSNMTQLKRYVDLNKGSVKGRYWFTEDWGDGDEQEVGIAGSYDERVDEDGITTIEFTSSPDSSYPPVNFAIPDEEKSFALGVVKVCSRRSLKIIA